jgi:hypothetical protein
MRGGVGWSSGIGSRASPTCPRSPLRDKRHRAGGTRGEQGNGDLTPPGPPSPVPARGEGTSAVLASVRSVRLPACRAVPPRSPVEANPETVDPTPSSGRHAYEAGFNRISIGAQSFRRRAELATARAAGTARVADRGRRAEAARSAGFANVSLDLIYALPGRPSRAGEATLLTRALALPSPSTCRPTGSSLRRARRWHARGERGGDRARRRQRSTSRCATLTLELCAAAGLRATRSRTTPSPGLRVRAQHDLLAQRALPRAGRGRVELPRRRAQREPAGARGLHAPRMEGGARARTAYRERLDSWTTRSPEALMMGLRMTAGLELCGAGADASGRGA